MCLMFLQWERIKRFYHYQVLQTEIILFSHKPRVHTLCGFEQWWSFKLKSACLLSLSHRVTHSGMFGEKESEVSGSSSQRDKHSNANIYYLLASEQGKAITAEREKWSRRIQHVAWQEETGTEGQTASGGHITLNREPAVAKRSQLAPWC